MLKALIFDVDGTLADTEMAHLAAFNHAFAEFGLDWRWDVPLYTRLLGISGGKERIKAYWQTELGGVKDISGAGMQETIDRLHDIKTAAYEQAVQDGAVKMRPGVLALLSQASASGLQLAIATTTSPVNISALLRKAIGPDWQQYFWSLKTHPLRRAKNQTPWSIAKLWRAWALRHRPAWRLKILKMVCVPPWQRACLP